MYFCQFACVVDVSDVCTGENVFGGHSFTHEQHTMDFLVLLFCVFILKCDFRVCVLHAHCVIRCMHVSLAKIVEFLSVSSAGGLCV